MLKSSAGRPAMTRLQPRAAGAALALSSLLLSSCAASPLEVARADRISLGRNSLGDPCTATRTWKDAAVSNLFDASFAISCRNAAASRSVGFIRVVEDRPEAVAAVEATLSCGASSEVDLAGLGRAEARRCHDRAIGGETVVLSLSRKGRRLIGSGAPALAGVVEEGLRLVSASTPLNADAGRQPKPAFDFSSLAPPTMAADGLAGTGDFDPSVALQQGISLNHKGLHVEASRVLNDALSRLAADASQMVRAQLSLEAGLADSNIRFTESAAEHFQRADAIIASGAATEYRLLARKRDTYRALELLNRRQFRAALVALEQLVSAPAGASQPLQDIALLRSLNQPNSGSRDVANAVAVPTTDTLAQLVLDAQANWARSVAMLALGDVEGAERTLTQAEAAFAPLRTERIDPAPVLWLNARIERQRGRLQARRGDHAAAIVSFDRAVATLERSSIQSQGTGNEPAIAELRLERAGVIAAQGGSADVAMREYDRAVDALIASKTAGTTLPLGIERYLDLLVAEAAGGAKEDTYERYFRALQAVGEPAVARQLTQLQNIVTSDPSVGAKVRDRADLERELTGLRYQIGASTASNATAIASLEAQRQQVQERLQALEAEIAADPRMSTIEDRPATIADIRQVLRPGEVFFKISELNRKAYGIVVAADQTHIYPIELPVAALDDLADSVRESIDGQLDTRKLVAFRVPEAYALFGLIAGPAMGTLLQADAIVVDPAGPLERLPLGVLVTDRASVDAYGVSSRSNAFDYSAVNFLAKKAAISTALSPRSFLVSRALPPSQARKPFIGFAEHVVPREGPRFASAAPIGVGNVCSAEFSALRELAARMKPIDSAEIETAAAALGVAGAPLVTGEQFTDTAVAARDDLDQYEVLHFATHGLEEGVWGCDKSPPALVTSFGDQDSDGLLSFSEIGRLRLDANLVVLSACDTGSGVKNEALARGSGQEEAGSTLEGLVRAFLTANSRAVLATHWQVSAEQETNDLMRTFYSSGRNQSIGTALQSAQRSLMTQADYSHPFYWGAYFVVGDSSKMMLASNAGGQMTASPR
jgi:CHAT domain-containing protein